MVLPPRLHLTRRLPPLNVQQLLSLHPTISPRRGIHIFSDSRTVVSEHNPGRLFLRMEADLV